MPQTSLRLTMAACLFGCLAVSASAAQVPANAPLPDKIEFNRDIRPILSANCYQCHGPDAGERKADLRLDTKAGLLSAIKDIHPIVPGDPQHSEVFRRITTDNPDDRMPEPKSGRRLDARQIALIKKWIEQGAHWQGHWAFTAPVRPPLPEVKDTGWVRNPIDRFILSQIEAERLKPSLEADKATLIRRVTLDLTGLPPTPQEIDAFLADKSPDAYEKVVDRLLANPHYGERMTLDWLDAARFADTHGYHIDSGRDMTHWRDWVINAYNSNKPFDQFAVEQLAGDLLPNATVDQKIASGFNRNSMINFEGGAIPQEYLTQYLIDRVDTTSTVFLGLTLRCCQCHDHKYDPFTQKDFYSMYAFFNAMPENGLDGQKGNAVPVLQLPTKEQQAKLAEFDASISRIEKALTEPNPQLDEAQARWERSFSGSEKAQWTLANPQSVESKGGATFDPLDDHSIAVTGSNPDTDVYTITLKTSLALVTGLRLEAIPTDKLADGGPGRSANGNFVLTGVHVQSGSDPGKLHAVRLSAAEADFSQDKFPVESLLKGGLKAGWAIFPRIGERHTAMFQFERPVEANDATVFKVRLDFESHFAKHQIGRFRIALTSSPMPVRSKAPADLAKIIATPAEKRSKEQADQLREYFRTTYAPQLRDAVAELKKVRDEKAALEKKVPTTMVMQDMAKPRETHILLRGQYDKFGERVYANTPASLPPMPAGTPHNRLGLAKWIVSPQNPLTARVMVNRLWQSFFGTGIVKTPGDFGTQGDLPSHPELLDWLAVQFRDGDEHTHKWDVKAMVRLIVTSATYRQSSHLTPELAAKDPEDRLLACGPRFRLHAEFIRDQALAVSGLLSPEIGGASVFPYQPKGLWEELMSRSDGANWTAQVYTPSHGKDLYKRSMYTFWKRTSPPPSLSAFDAPDREVCTVKRVRTNTPLQALVLWNDPTYVEASRKMAERVLLSENKPDDERIAFAFRLATARFPKPAEVAVLKQILESQFHRFRADTSGAEKLLTVGESPRNQQLDTSRLAAWTMVCSTILNLDETVTRG